MRSSEASRRPFSSDHPVNEIGARSLLRIRWRGGVFLGSIGFYFVEEVAHMIRISLGGSGAPGFFGDAVTHVVEHWEELSVDNLLMRIRRGTEPQVVDVHECDQVAERRRFDRAQLVECLACIWPFEHPDQARQGLQESSRFLIGPDTLEGHRRQLAAHVADQLVSSLERGVRDVALGLDPAAQGALGETPRFVLSAQRHRDPCARRADVAP